MPKRSLTQLAVERIGPPASGRLEYWDKHQPGLALRVSATGAKSWIVMYRVDGRQVRETIGIAAKIPVETARRLALASLTKARSGVNPIAERRAAAAAEAARDAKTFAAVAERFLNEYVPRRRQKKLRPSTIHEYRRMLDKDLLPVWGEKPIQTITKADVNDLLDRKAARFKLQADEVRKHLRTLFRWALDVDLIPADPTAGTLLRGQPEAHERVLSDREIHLFWRACDKIGWPFRDVFRLLLLTAQRRTEIAGIRWQEIEGQTWTIPASRAKNGRTHIVHLSDASVAIINGLPRLGEMVFSTTGVTPVSGYSHAKLRLDRVIAEVNGGPIPNWVLHDLRRTATTGLAKLRVPPHICDRVLNHVSGAISGVAAIYNQYQYEEERRNALDKWGAHIERLVAPREDVVRALVR